MVPGRVHINNDYSVVSMNKVVISDFQRSPAVSGILNICTCKVCMHPKETEDLR